jgi:hypothetical protein
VDTDAEAICRQADRAPNACTGAIAMMKVGGSHQSDIVEEIESAAWKSQDEGQIAAWIVKNVREAAMIAVAWRRRKDPCGENGCDEVAMLRAGCCENEPVLRAAN